MRSDIRAVCVAARLNGHKNVRAYLLGAQRVGLKSIDISLHPKDVVTFAGAEYYLLCASAPTREDVDGAILYSSGAIMAPYRRKDR